ncbi:Elongation factor Ts [Anaerohalosphaera lusitana]|uniref:Elongation factor Ts n=1 Tax=Anaerohalosphaera lusitana TaxID=1936003 RepID=A0A1U9NQH6_9BACT|nr:translation elongation factor Ts [Anaerohalosphaera lusitana]AQT70181.1 Elongation factor Ts [Anaerohalosphaera lusitana]
MAEISASQVMKLRKMSGQGMMDCKKALKEADGDLDKALEELRKKGLKTMAKRAGRETSEGIVLTQASDDGKTVAMGTLCCETDFVAKSEDFKSLAEKMSSVLLTVDGVEGAETIVESEVDGKKFSELITECVSKTGEKTEVVDFIRISLEKPGTIGTYTHFNNKIGAMVVVETSNDETAKAVEDVARDAAMHVSAINPVAVDRDSIDAETIERERAAAAEEVQNKPANIIDKIVDGKMNKFFKENCLVDQPFVKDDSKTVSEAVSEAAKAAGGEAKITRFIRFEIG